MGAQPEIIDEVAGAVTGTLGSASVTHTELTIALKDQPGDPQIIPLQGSWFPDAFGGSMGELLQAIAEGRQPMTSGDDNLATIRMASAAELPATIK